MKNMASFRRKVVYLGLMALLLVPLYWISSPSFQNASGQLSPGGLLTRERQKHGLSQSKLGDIDPASESMKLAMLGMRGIAANLLWERANEYKKKEQWDKLSATLNQIAKLQPNFISVWQFQSWNLSYNVSVEFDNYEHRYHWVKKGIDFLMQGIKYNRNEPRLLWDLGWFFGHKLGRSDEYRQFRRKYRTDSDFHATLPIDVDEAVGPDGRPDNWLTAYQWFRKAQRVVDKEGVPIKGKNPLVFHSDAAKALIRFSDAIEEEGYLNDQAALAWERAHRAWLQYGDRDIPTSYGYNIRLNEGEKWQQLEIDREQELADLLPGTKDRLLEERLRSLTAEELRLLKRPKAELDADEYKIVSDAEAKTAVTPDDIVAAAPPEKYREARRIANRLLQAKGYATTVRRYRDIVNFIYWRTRCEVEKTDRAIQARKYLYEADQAYRDADLVGAREKYEEAWQRWAQIHEEYPVLADDVTAEDLVDPLKRYRTLLGHFEETFPPPGFKLLRLVAAYADDFGFSNEQAEEMLASIEEASDDGSQDGSDDSDENGESEPVEEETSTDHAPSEAATPGAQEEKTESARQPAETGTDTSAETEIGTEDEDGPDEAPDSETEP